VGVDGEHFTDVLWPMWQADTAEDWTATRCLNESLTRLLPPQEDVQEQDGAGAGAGGGGGNGCGGVDGTCKDGKMGSGCVNSRGKRQTHVHESAEKRKARVRTGCADSNRIWEPVNTYVPQDTPKHLRPAGYTSIARDIPEKTLSIFIPSSCSITSIPTLLLN